MKVYYFREAVLFTDIVDEYSARDVEQLLLDKVLCRKTVTIFPKLKEYYLQKVTRIFSGARFFKKVAIHFTLVRLISVAEGKFITPFDGFNHTQSQIVWMDQCPATVNLQILNKFSIDGKKYPDNCAGDWKGAGI